jgi:hypothetical protein
MSDSILVSTIRRLAGGVALAGLAVTAAAADQPVQMAAHRATYDLSLADRDGGKGVETARGRIVFEFTGSACEGYTQNFRQVTELSGGDIGTRLSDMRSSTFEEGDGSALRFNTETRVSGGKNEAADGVAERKDGKVAVTLKKPQPGKASLSEAVFPTAQIKMIVEAAREGRPTVSVKVFDGSEQGKKAYDTFTVIGKQADGGAAVEDTLKAAGWDKLPRWPVSVSYFEEGGDASQPLYVISFELLENGVSRKLKLDYGDFGLNGTLTRLDVIKAAPCDK